jgi:hypothetical protein
MQGRGGQKQPARPTPDIDKYLVLPSLLFSFRYTIFIIIVAAAVAAVVYPSSIQQAGKEEEVKLAVGALQGRFLSGPNVGPVSVGATHGIPLFQLFRRYELVESFQDVLVGYTGFGNGLRIGVGIFLRRQGPHVSGYACRVLGSSSWSLGCMSSRREKWVLRKNQIGTAATTANNDHNVNQQSS